MGRTWPLNNFDDHYTKRFLEEYTYGKAGKTMNSHLMMITGPDVLDHLSNAIKIAKTKKFNTYIIEKDRGVYNEINRRIQEIAEISYSSRNKIEYNVWWSDNKVIVVYGDVKNYENLLGLKLPCRLEDLDLCEAFKTNEGVFRNRLLRQSGNHGEKYNGLTKVFMGTVCLRGYGHGLLDTLKNINTNLLSILGAERAIEDDMYVDYLIYKGWEWGVNSIKMYEPEILKQGRMKTLDLYTYRDGSPMLCFVITYK